MTTMHVVGATAAGGLDPRIRYVSTGEPRVGYRAVPSALPRLAVRHEGDEVRLVDETRQLEGRGPSYLDALQALEAQAARHRDDLT